MREPTGRRVGRMKELWEDVGGRRMRGEGKGEGEKGRRVVVRRIKEKEGKGSREER